MKFRHFIITSLLLIACCNYGYSIKIDNDTKQKLDSIVIDGLKNRAFPGASLVVGDKDGIVYKKNYGYLDYQHKQPVTDSTIYDIASCTKVLSTTFVIMKLYDEGKIKLDQQIGDLVPELKDSRIESIKISELLTHTSGIPYQPMYSDIAKDSTYLTQYNDGGYRKISDKLYINPAVDTMIINRICKGYNPARRGRYRYDDSNFYLLRLAVENITGRPLDELTDELFKEMDCNNIGYNPLLWKNCDQIAPTENDAILRKCLVRGYVHDEFAAILGGVGGNAGLFASACDMANFCEMLLCDGNFRGKQILSKETVRTFTSSPFKSRGVYRGLGFDKRSPNSNALGGEEAFGHTGFTGTIFWIDRSKGFYMIFLSNSVHPTRENTYLNRSGLRVKLWSTLKSNVSTE